MADPVVHITNGIPDTGTGNITTLGQTIQLQASASAGQLGPLVQGAVTTAAPTYTNGNTNPLSLDASGNLRTSVNNTVPVTGTFWQATQPVSGTVTVNGTVGISGTVACTQSGIWNITNISGTVSLPTGAATAAKQPALGTAGTPSLDVITVQGAASMTALKVDGSGVTQPISGNVGISGNVNCVQVTSPWVTSVSGNVTCVQSGNWTARCVGNAGGIFDFSSAQNVATPNSAVLIGAEFNAVPTTITTGNSSPLQLDNAANLLVNVKSSVLPTGAASAANQPSNAAQGSTTSGQTGTLGLGAVTTASPSYTTGQTNALSLDTAGNLRVNVVAGGGAGGTSSTFGSAVPGTGTAVGYSDGTLMQLARVFDGDSGAGTQWDLGVLLKTPASGGAVDIGVSGQPLRVDPTGTTTQPVSGSVSVTGSVAVTGTFWQATQPVSGTVTANQGGTWTVQPGNTANTTAWLVTGTGGTFPATQSGTWNINNISGAISLPTGAATSANQPTAAAAASTTSGQTGNLSFGAVTSGPPTYTTATSNALSLTTAGALRIDGSGVTQPISGTITAQQATAANLNATVVGTGTFAVQAAQTGTWTSRIVGNAGAVLDFAGQNAAAPANSILIGGEFNTTPATITSGNASPLQMDSAGNLLVNVKAGGGSGGTSSSFGSAFPATGTAAGAEYLSSPPTLTSGNMCALQCDSSGNLNVNIKAGAGSGGTALADEATFTFGTTQGTPAYGVYQTTATNNALTTGQVGAWQFTANRAGFVNLRNAAGTEVGTSGAPIRIDPTGTTVQPVSGTFWQATQPVSGTITANQGGAPWSENITQFGGTNISTGTGVGGAGIPRVTVSSDSVVGVSGTVTVSGTVAATQSGNWTSRVVGNAGGIVDGVIGAATAPANMIATGGVFNTTKPTLTTGQSSAIQLNSSGIQLVDLSSTGANTTAIKVDGSAVTQPVSGTFWQATQPVSGTVTANQGGTWNITNISGTVSLPTGAATSANQPSNAALGSTTSGQTGLLGLGAVTSAAPSYTTATSNALSLTTSGALRVDGSGVTQPVSGTVTAAQATAANLNATVVGTGTFAVQLTGATNNINNISGTVSLPTGAATAANQTNVQAASTQNVAVPGSLMLTGGQYNATPTAITSGNVSPLQVDTRGRLLAVSALRASKGVQKTSISVATETTVVTAGAAGIFQDVYAIVITNKSATSVFVDFRDATAGTVRMTLAAPANDTRGFTVTTDSAMVQAAAANNWTATVSSAVTSIEISMLYISNVA